MVYELMTGNEWMFYISLTLLVILLLTYVPIRIGIEIQKWKNKEKLQEELGGKR